MAVMLPFAQLWGPDGTIMRSLGQALPGIQIYLLLIAGLLTFFYLRRIKDPESGIHDIFSFILVIGSISLLVFGNLIVLIFLIGLFIGGYYLVQIGISKSEHEPSGAAAALHQMHPDLERRFSDMEAGFSKLTSKEAKTASQEKHIGHDLVVLAEDESAIASISEKTARSIAELSTTEMSVEEREAAILKILQEKAAELKKHMGEALSLPGAEQQARFILNQAIASIQQQAKQFTDNELDLLGKTSQEAKDIIANTELIHETAKRGQQLGKVITTCVGHLDDKKIHGAGTVAAIRQQRKEALAQAAKETDATIKASLTSKAEALEGLSTRAEVYQSQLENYVKNTKTALAQAVPLVKRLFDSGIESAQKNVANDIQLLEFCQAKLKENHQLFLAKTTDASQSKEAPETYGGPLIVMADGLFKALIASREERHKFDSAVQAVLNRLLEITQDEGLIAQQIDKAISSFALVESTLQRLIDNMSKEGIPPTDASALDAAQQAFQSFEQSGVKSQQDMLVNVQRTIRSAWDRVSQRVNSTQSQIETAKKAHDAIINDLRSAITAMVNAQTKIIDIKAKRLEQAQAATDSAAKKANAA